MRKRTLLAFVALLTVWPVFHIYLVKQFDVSPWKLAGWGMYAAPWRTPWARVELLERGSWIAPDPKNPPPWLRARLQEFSNSRAALGQLCPPDRIADELWNRRPDVTEMKITVQEAVLDPKTGMIIKRETPYVYKR